VIRIFVGTACNHDDLESQSVLEWSIRKHASQPVEITWMHLSHDPASPWSGWRTETWATPFSAFRWAIPEVCGFEGKAIYTDSDVIFMADIAELWNQPLAPGKVALAKGGGSWRYCVSLWDCVEAQKHIPPLAKLKADPDAHQMLCGYFAKHRELTQSFQGDWNCLDGEGHADLRDGSLKALHYTAMDSQPHLRHALPRLAKEGRKHWFNGKVRRHPRRDIEELFDKLLAEAKANGFPPERYADVPVYGDFRKASLVGYRSRAA
jgi:hypothetical protein